MWLSLLEESGKMGLDTFQVTSFSFSLMTETGQIMECGQHKEHLIFHKIGLNFLRQDGRSLYLGRTPMSVTMVPSLGGMRERATLVIRSASDITILTNSAAFYSTFHKLCCRTDGSEPMCPKIPNGEIRL